MSFQFNRKPATESSHGDIDLKPFINFLVVLIPVLMLSAEFSKTTVHKLDVNKEGASPQIPDKNNSTPVENRLKLTLLITDTSFTVGTNYGFLPSLNYKEYSSYIQKKNRKNIAIVANDSKENATYKTSDFDKSEIILYTLKENNTCDSAYYYTTNGL
jgi:biopolymer transport protein ExbD